MNNVSLWAVKTVWMRYFAVFQKNLFYGLVTTALEPFLYLLSFGLGLGSIIPDLHFGDVTITYRKFVLVGIVGQAVLFQSFFEAAYGSFVRMYYQKIFQAMASTPITLTEVLIGELLWDATKAFFSAFIVLLLGLAIGDFTLHGVILSLPVLFIAALTFSAIGIITAAKSKTIDIISYPQFIIIFPMFLFCGVFFPLSNLPKFLEMLINLLPLAAFLSLTRSFTIGLTFDWTAIVVLLFWFAILVPIAYKSMQNRLVA